MTDDRRMTRRGFVAARGICRRMLQLMGAGARGMMQLSRFIAIAGCLALCFAAEGFEQVRVAYEGNIKIGVWNSGPDFSQFGGADDPSSAVKCHAGRMPDADKIELEGDYAGHLQDVWWDGGTNLWWAHTLQILRTDLAGKIVARADVDGHNAGCEVRDGVLYVAVCPMQNKTGGKTTPDCRLQVNEYDAATLALMAKHVLPINDRAGSLAMLPDGSFVVGCLRPQDISPTQVRMHHLSRDFHLVKSVVLDNVEVKLGIETIKYRDGELFLSMYKGKGLLVVLDAETFKEKRRQDYGGTMGLVFDGDFAWCGQTRRNPDAKKYSSCLVRRNAP